LIHVTVLQSLEHPLVAIWEHSPVGQITTNTACELDGRGMTMASESKNNDANFSFGVRELRKAKARDPLSLDTSKLKLVNENHGSDPYNTSGSFDRTKNWTRIGKR
jgi:hypothetical protein